MEGKIHIYCINLKHRSDRWERFSQQPELKRLQDIYTFERFEGINGSTLDIQKDERISLRTKRNIKEHTRRDHEELDSAGGVGCYLSHVGIWKKMMERPEPYAIIFEDDALIPPGFLDNFQDAMKDLTLLPQIPDIWSFSDTHKPLFDVIGKPLPVSVREYRRGPWTTHECTTFTGYLISKEGARKLLENVFPIDMHIDLYAYLNSELNRILFVKHANVATPAVSLKTNDTDIQSKEDCPICAVPTKYRERGMILLNIPITIIGFATIGAMMYLTRGGKGLRR